MPSTPLRLATRIERVRDSIHRALPGPKGDQWATAYAVAEVVDMGYSTVTEHLRAMAADGRVESIRQGRATLWRTLIAAPKLRLGDVATPRASLAARAVPTGPRRAPKQAAKAKRNRAKDPALNRSESDPAAPGPGAVPQPPDAARAPNGGGVGDVVGFLEAVRPVSAAPAPSDRKARTPRAPKGDRQPFAAWGRGELQVAILDYLRSVPDGYAHTPTQVARALNSHSGAVAYGLVRLVVKGEVKQAGTDPMRYAAA